jgi:prevent-host-death family protein
MREIGAYEAKTHLPKLLERVEKKGERFVITRHGKPVAELVPVAQRSTQKIRQAIDNLKNFQSHHRLGVSVRDMIQEGRKY